MNHNHIFHDNLNSPFLFSQGSQIGLIFDAGRRRLLETRISTNITDD